jgi:hypothetical protein
MQGGVVRRGDGQTGTAMEIGGCGGSLEAGTDCGDRSKGFSGQFGRLVNCDWVVVLRVVLGTSRVQVVAWEGRGRTTHSALSVKEVGESSRVDWL